MECETVKIKLCGMMTLRDIEVVNGLNPDYIGFIFAPKSRRYVTKTQAAAMKAILDPEIQAVGVFVNEKPEVIAGYVKEGIIDVVQLHGQENEEDIQKLRTLTERPIIQAFRIQTEADIEKAVRSSADLILLDAGTGGTGTSFDWNLIQNIKRPWLLAGGLYPENVAEAIRQLKPYGVDVSSGIETDGKKDSRKMERFVKNIEEERL